jgi:hypothetical protein
MDRNRLCNATVKKIKKVCQNPLTNRGVYGIINTEKTKEVKQNEKIHHQIRTQWYHRSLRRIRKDIQRGLGTSYKPSAVTGREGNKPSFSFAWAARGRCAPNFVLYHSLHNLSRVFCKIFLKIIFPKSIDKPASM